MLFRYEIVKDKASIVREAPTSLVSYQKPMNRPSKCNDASQTHIYFVYQLMQNDKEFACKGNQSPYEGDLYTIYKKGSNNTS